MVISKLQKYPYGRVSLDLSVQLSYKLFSCMGCSPSSRLKPKYEMALPLGYLSE